MQYAYYTSQYYTKNVCYKLDKHYAYEVLVECMDTASMNMSSNPWNEPEIPICHQSSSSGSAGRLSVYLQFLPNDYLTSGVSVTKNSKTICIMHFFYSIIKKSVKFCLSIRII